MFINKNIFCITNHQLCSSSFASEAALGNKQGSENQNQAEDIIKFNKVHIVITYLVVCHRKLYQKKKKKHVTSIIFWQQVLDKSFEAIVASACE